MPEWQKKKQKFVYFNSNEFLGYSNRQNVLPTKDDAQNIIEQSNYSLLTQNADILLSNAEFNLLKTMVHFSSARRAMKAALSKRMDGSSSLMEWSTSEREWLFHCLTGAPGHEPLPQEIQDGGTISQLKDHLQMRSDVPDGAFKKSKVDDESSLSSLDGDTWYDSTAVDDFVNGQRLFDESKSTKEGSLDLLFEESVEDVTKVELGKYSISHEERAELTVQETVATMLKASALKRLDRLKNDWRFASEALAKREVNQKDTLQDEYDSADESTLKMYDKVDDDELKSLCDNIGREVVEAAAVVRELSESLRQLQSRLLDYCGADGSEGRNSQAQQDELAKMLAEHIASLNNDDRESPGSSEDYIFGSDEFRDDMDVRYGGISRPMDEISNFEKEDKSLFGPFE